MFRRLWHRGLSLLLMVVLTATLALPALAHTSATDAKFPKEIKSEHFTVKYTTEGSDATTDAYAQQVSDEAETMLALFRKHGFKDLYGDAPWSVTVANLNEAWGTATGWPDGPTVIQMNRSLATDGKELGGSISVMGHEVAHGIQARYIPNLDELPGYLVEGTPTPMTFAVSEDPALKKTMRAYDIKGYINSGRRRTLQQQEHDAAGYWMVLQELYGGATFFRQLWEQVATKDLNTIVQSMTGMSEEALFHTFAVRLYSHFLWSVEADSGSAAETKFDASPLASAEALAKLNAGEKVTVATDTKKRPLQVRSYTISTVSLSEASQLSGPLSIKVNAASNVSVYALVGSGDATTYDHYVAASASGGDTLVIDPRGATQVMLLVLRTGSTGRIDYSLELQASSASLSKLESVSDLLTALPNRLTGTSAQALKERLAALLKQIEALTEKVKQLQAQLGQ